MVQRGDNKLFVFSGAEGAEDAVEEIVAQDGVKGILLAVVREGDGIAEEHDGNDNDDADDRSNIRGDSALHHEKADLVDHFVAGVLVCDSFIDNASDLPDDAAVFSE